MFRRRRRDDADQPGSDDSEALGGQELEDDLGDQDDWPDDEESPDDESPDDEWQDEEWQDEKDLPGEEWQDESNLVVAGGAVATGPWDGAVRYPDGERVDLGSLLVPAGDDLDIQINMAEDQGVWVSVVHGDSALQLQAFAAPKTSGLWEDVRREIAEEIAKSGGESSEAEGPFGPELHARVNPDPERRGRPQLAPVRFLGVDGPRWFLRGVISGPAARRPELARPFEAVFSDVVVVRGDHPAPPRDLLEITLPEEARRAIEEQMAREGNGVPHPNPFERGPEITETR